MTVDSGDVDVPGVIDAVVPACSEQMPDLPAVIEGMRRAWQESLLAAAKDRSENDRRFAASVAKARQHAARFAPEQGLLDRYARAWQLYGNGGTAAESSAPTTIDDAEQTWRSAVQRCEESLLSFRQQRAEADAARRKASSRRPGDPVLSARFADDLAVMRATLEALPALQAEEVRAADEHARCELAAESDRRRCEREVRLADVIDHARAVIDQGLAIAGPAAMGWEAFFAGIKSSQQSGSTAGWIRLGAYDLAAPSGSVPEVPCLVEFPFKRVLAIRADATHGAAALSLARSVILRALCAMPAGELTLSIVDPVALGGSVADFLRLGDYSAPLIDTKPWTTAQEIAWKLSELSAHLGVVISKYLRGQYASIAEYNAVAADMAEPYKLLAVFGFPAQFTDGALARLAGIIENGPRCGLLALLVGEDPENAGYDRLIAEMDVVTWTDDGQIRLKQGGGSAGPQAIPDRCPDVTFTTAGQPVSAAAAALELIGRSAPMVHGSGPGGHAFISYVREDALHVDRLQSALEAAGVPVWRDTASLWPGEDWRSKIRGAIIEDALVFISCFSRSSLARPKTYQYEELTLAIEQLRLRNPDRPWLIPVRFDDCEIPDVVIGGARTLGSVQRCDLFGEQSESELMRLTSAVLRILGSS